MEYEILNLRDRPEWAGKAARWFHSKWHVPLSAYEESIAQCLAGEGPVPQWYLAVDGDTILGGMGVIENDFHERFWATSAPIWRPWALIPSTLPPSIPLFMNATAGNISARPRGTGRTT